MTDDNGIKWLVESLQAAFSATVEITTSDTEITVFFPSIYLRYKGTVIPKQILGDLALESGIVSGIDGKVFDSENLTEERSGVQYKLILRTELNPLRDREGDVLFHPRYGWVGISKFGIFSREFMDLYPRQLKFEKKNGYLDWDRYQDEDGKIFEYCYDIDQSIRLWHHNPYWAGQVRGMRRVDDVRGDRSAE